MKPPMGGQRKAKTMAQSNAATSQGMATNVTHVLHQNPDTVLNNVRQLVDIHNKAGVRLCCGIAHFLFVRAYAFDDNQRWEIERSRDYLKAQLNESGLKRAMTYRYIETGHKLAQRFVAKYKLGGVVHDILNAENEGKAFEIILKATHGLAFLPDPTKPVKAWNTDAEHKPRLSMDVLRVNLGLEQLDATKQPGYVAPTAGPVDANNPGAALGGTAPVTATVPATKAKPASIIARMKADKDFVKSIPSEIIVGACDVIGREKMAERLVSLMTLAECMQLQTAIVGRMKALSEAPKEEPKAEPAKEPEATPEAQPEGEQTEQTETVSRRKRNRNRNKAA